MTPPTITHDAQAASVSALPAKRKRLDSIAAFELKYMRIVQANIAILRRRQLDERRQRRFEKIASYWPLWLGVLLAVISPQLEAIAQSYGSVGMTLVFPFVEL